MRNDPMGERDIVDLLAKHEGRARPALGPPRTTMALKYDTEPPRPTATSGLETRARIKSCAMSGGAHATSAESISAACRSAA